MPPEPHESSWVEYQRLVLSELERHTKDLDALRKELQIIREEIVMLKVKAGVWGAVAGLVPVAIALAIMAIQRGA